MEERDALGGAFNGTYNKLTHDDFGGDDHPLYADREGQHVSMSMVRTVSSTNHYRKLTVSLAAVAAILLAVDIGLGAYYRSLDSSHRTVEDIGREIAKLQASYDAAVHRKEDAQTRLRDERAQQKTYKWEEEHEKKRSADYQTQIGKIRKDVSMLKSRMLMIEEGCRHCSPGWIYIHSSCYYFAHNEARNWNEARRFCKSRGGDLPIIDSRDKQMKIGELIYGNLEAGRPLSQSGYWIGLTDEEDEGVWKWVDGTPLLEGFWNYGEPNNQNNEDCAASYPRTNPFNGWNDAPCNHHLKWICEKPAALVTV